MHDLRRPEKTTFSTSTTIETNLIFDETAFNLLITNTFGTNKAGKVRLWRIVMALRNVFGIVRSDTGLGVNDIWASGNTFSSSLAQTITIDLGADDTIFDGDPSTGNGQPNDTSQTYDDGAGAHAFFYDFSVLVTGSDGETYEVAVFDYDQNDNGNVFDIRDPGVAVEVAENANEGDYFYAFINGSPPPGITLQELLQTRTLFCQFHASQEAH